NEELLSLKKEQNVLKEIPYEPQNGYAGILVEEEDAEHYYIKGSPEVILDACDISSKQKEDIIESIEEYATKGYRNIALAHKKSGEDFALEGFEWIGFVAIIDPLREGVAQSVKKAREAGIDVSMITGDHPSTAFYIAKELGIAKEQDEVISGKELQLWIDKGEDPKEIKNKRVFARVSPEQKKRLVDAFQKLGHYVAVTGDGVNDAPALKHSNIGISMGISGTDVARETSDIILTDDHFGSIVNGIEEGRVAYDNIRKVVYLLVSTGFAEIILVGLSMLFLLPLPLLPVQLLWLNLVTNGIQHIALGLDKAEPGVLQRKPRDPKEPIFNKVMIRRIVIGGGYMGLVAFLLFSWLTSMGVAEDEARNLTLLLMVLFENVHAINSKSERVYLFSMNLLTNKLLLGAIIIAQGVHILSMHIPTMQNILGTSPVPIQHWMMLLVVALSLVLLMEFDKYIANRRKFGK
ncbi:MAG: cation-translocating P-type ATPase, partial [Campylobacterales bacterium]